LDLLRLGFSLLWSGLLLYDLLVSDRFAIFWHLDSSIINWLLLRGKSCLFLSFFLFFRVLLFFIFQIFTIGVANTELTLFVVAPAVNSAILGSGNGVVLSSINLNNIVALIWIEFPDSCW
jgi:hypothetical protein